MDRLAEKVGLDLAAVDHVDFRVDVHVVDFGDILSDREVVGLRVAREAAAVEGGRVLDDLLPTRDHDVEVVLADLLVDEVGANSPRPQAPVLIVWDAHFDK